jgi:hypothetical protein
MATTSESGFGAKLQNAKDIHTTIESFGTYKHAREEDSLTAYLQLIQDCDTINSAVAANLQGYTLAVDKRSKCFKGKEPSCLDKKLSPIGKAVAGQYDKTSKEYTSVMGIITKMRSQKLEKSPANPTEDKKESISKSELSYGSMLQNFKDLISSLEVFGNFTPVNEDISLANLKAFATELENANKDAKAKIVPLNTAREKRNVLFDELNKRTQRIKSNVSSQYGNDSAEFKQIKGLKV